MALVLADRVKETTTTTGTGTVTLAGAATGYQSFAAIGDGNSTYYTISGGSEWEVGIGTYASSGTTLSRDTVLSSSNANALVSFSAGTKDVFCSYPAEKAIAAGTGYFSDQFTGTFVDGVVVDYVSGYGRIYVGGSDGIQFLTNAGADLLATAFADGDWNLTGYLSIGSGTVISGAVNPLFEINAGANNYVQAYIHNDSSGTSASADFVAYPDNGADASGWIDFGATSSGYADATYTVTGPNEGYLFNSAPSGAGATGNLVYATDSTGSENAHQWYVGGFTQLKTAYKMQLGSNGFDLKTTLLLNGSAGTSGYVLTSAGAGSTPTWQPAGGGGSSPGGSSGQVQYNDGAGGFAGAANVSIDNDDLVLLENASFTVPSSNSVKLIARDIATRSIPAYVGPSGLDSALQPLLGRNKVGYWSGIAGATTNIGTGIALTATGTATSATWATTNLISTMNRLDFRATTAATNAVSGFRGGASNYWRGNSAGLGGFTYICRWGIGGLGTSISTIRAFVGLRASTSAPTDVAPNTLTNAVGMGWDSTDSTVQIYSCGSANSKIDTGITLNRVISTNASAQVFEIAMFCPPNGSSISYTVTELGTSNTYSTTVTTTTALPSSTTALNVYGYTSAGGTNTSMSIAVCGIYIETDY